MSAHLDDTKVLVYAAAEDKAGRAGRVNHLSSLSPAEAKSLKPMR